MTFVEHGSPILVPDTSTVLQSQVPMDWIELEQVTRAAIRIRAECEAAYHSPEAVGPDLRCVATWTRKVGVLIVSLFIMPGCPEIIQRPVRKRDGSPCELQRVSGR